jgi:hypothetical protein
MGLLRRLLLSPIGLIGVVLLLGIVGLHFGQIRHDRLPLDLDATFPPGSRPVPGQILGTTMAVLIDHELKDGFGWRPNDFPLWGPQLWADNNSNRQLGILEALRKTALVMQENLTKISSNAYDPNLLEAERLLRNDEYRLWIPSAESRYREAADHYRKYVAGLAPEIQTSQPLTQRHVELLRLFELWSNLLGDAHARLYRTEVDGHALRPWRTDDDFYHVQGNAHVMAHVLAALEREYADVLAGRDVLKRLFEEVRTSLAQAATMKPFIVLDGGLTGIFANHRRNLGLFIAEARQKMYTIREELVN